MNQPNGTAFFEKILRHHRRVKAIRGAAQVIAALGQGVTNVTVTLGMTGETDLSEFEGWAVLVRYVPICEKFEHTVIELAGPLAELVYENPSLTAEEADRSVCPPFASGDGPCVQNLSRRSYRQALSQALTTVKQQWTDILKLAAQLERKTPITGKEHEPRQFGGAR